MNIPELSVEQMKEVDRIMMNDLGVSVYQMMENAGRLLANLAVEKYNPERVCILAGPGNNGGGGLVAARYLHNRGVSVSIVLASDNMKEAPMRQAETARALNIPFRQKVKKTDLVIDALLGYSAEGAPRGRVEELIKEANNLNVPVLSNDIPSGFNLQTGEFHTTSFKQATTLALGLPKAHMAKAIKELYVGDIGIPPEVYEKFGIDAKGLLGCGDCIKVSSQAI